ncbi:MAG: DUF3189 family protein [bacterium]|jgi:hypothetical protein
MWIVYHGYQLCSTPLLAAIIHCHLFAPTDNSAVAISSGSDSLPPCEDTIFQLWRDIAIDKPSAVLSLFGIDNSRNKIFALGHKRFFIILQRTVKAGLKLTNANQAIVWVDTTVASNILLELGVWLMKRCAPTDEYFFHTLIHRGIKISVPRVFDLVRRTYSSI